MGIYEFDGAHDRHVISIGGEMSIMDQLTPRQQDVARLLGQGLSQQQIAYILKVKPGTIRRHTSNMRERTGICSTTMIAIKAHVENK